MTQTFDTMMEEAIWTARQLYSDGMVQGSAGNISFRLDDRIFISGSGTLFARLTREDFVEMDLDGQNKGAGTPSKEYPLHLALYQCQPQTKAVIHTHSFYTTLWSCMQKTDQEEIFPFYTPYLKMQFQSIGRVPYALPGSSQLFQAFREAVRPQRDGYVLENHGAVVSAGTMIKAYAKIQELETSARTAWLLKDSPARPLQFS